MSMTGASEESYSILWKATTVPVPHRTKVMGDADNRYAARNRSRNSAREYGPGDSSFCYSGWVSSSRTR